MLLQKEDEKLDQCAGGMEEQKTSEGPGNASCSHQDVVPLWWRQADWFPRALHENLI